MHVGKTPLCALAEVRVSASADIRIFHIPLPGRIERVHPVLTAKAGQVRSHLHRPAVQMSHFVACPRATGTEISGWGEAVPIHPQINIRHRIDLFLDYDRIFPK